MPALQYYPECNKSRKNTKQNLKHLQLVTTYKTCSLVIATSKQEQEQLVTCNNLLTSRPDLEVRSASVTLITLDNMSEVPPVNAFKNRIFYLLFSYRYVTSVLNMIRKQTIFLNIERELPQQQKTYGFRSLSRQQVSLQWQQQNQPPHVGHLQCCF